MKTNAPARQTKEQARDVIARNIRARVATMKAQDCTGASWRCLHGRTPTTGLTIDLAPSGYAELFRAVALSLRIPGFNIYDDAQ